MHIIVESVLALFTQNYQNQSILDETTACQSWLVFLRHSVVYVMTVLISVMLCECQLFSSALVVTQHCLRLASSFGDDSGIFSFLQSVTTVLRTSLCGVEWNLRDTAVEFIDKSFLAGSCFFLRSLVVVVIVNLKHSCQISVIFVTLIIIIRRTRSICEHYMISIMKAALG